MYSGHVCTCVHVPVEVQSYCQISSSITPPYIQEQGLPLEARASPGGQFALGVACLCLLSQGMAGEFHVLTVLNQALRVVW